MCPLHIYGHVPVKVNGRESMHVVIIWEHHAYGLGINFVIVTQLYVINLLKFCRVVKNSIK